MSIEVTTRVWQTSRQESSNLLVLLALADHADDDGFCFPSVGRLAEMARLSLRHCRRVLSELVASGELVRVEAGGGAKSTRYQVVLDGSTPDTHVTPDVGVTPDTHVREEGTPMSGGIGRPCPPPPDAHVLPPRTPMSSEPSVQPPIQPSVKPSEPPAVDLPASGVKKEPARRRSAAVNLAQHATGGNDVAVPDSLSGHGFPEAWASFCEYRSDLYRLKKTMWSALAAKSLLADCEKHGAAAGVQSIRRTIQSGKWTGLFFDGPAGQGKFGQKPPAARKAIQTFEPSPEAFEVEGPFAQSRRNRQRIQRERDGEPPPGWEDGGTDQNQKALA